MKITRRTIDTVAQKALLAAGIHTSLAPIFAARGVESAQQLEVTMAAMLSPASLQNCERAGQKLADAIARRARILIVADYDCDGATACAVAVRALRSFGAIVDYIVPNRFEFGYGLTPEIVALAAKRNPDVLVTVDNGIASHAGIVAANAAGIDVIVTDHHLPALGALPAASVIVNPNQPDDRFASKSLAGVGVVFYVMLALRAELRARGAFNDKREPNLAELLDLVALGTVADVVRLDHNNRILVEHGLRRIRAGRAQPGVNALLRVAGREATNASAYDLGFVAGPRLNAAGRLTDISLGIECLVSDDLARVDALATQLDTLNRERRAIEAEMRDDAWARLDAETVARQASVVIFDPEWHQGVIGIVASRIRERFHRPTLCFARAQPMADLGQSLLKGSGRSIPTLHLRDALDLVTKRAPDLIVTFGGHAAAAGLTIRELDLALFAATFEAVCQQLLSPQDLQHVLETDGTLDRGALNFELAKRIDAQVWGQGFAEPRFEGRFSVKSQKVVGEQHSRLWLDHAGSGIAAMRFGSVEPLPSSFDAVYRVGINRFRGESTLQVFIEHVL
jgi:single-stranded-DNA-specific exonuclease